MYSERNIWGTQLNKCFFHAVWRVWLWGGGCERWVWGRGCQQTSGNLGWPDPHPPPYLRLVAFEFFLISGCLLKINLSKRSKKLCLFVCLFVGIKPENFYSDYFFWFWIHTASVQSTAGTSTDGGTVIRKPGSAWLEGTPANGPWTHECCFEVDVFCLLEVYLGCDPKQWVRRNH